MPDPIAPVEPPPARALAWGYPTDIPGHPGELGRGPSHRTFVSAVVLTALLAGGAGGWVGSRGGGERTIEVHDTTASLGAPVTAVPVSRPATSVAGISARVLRSVVSIQVDSGTTGGTGSGVVLRSDGYILTNNHVVADGGTITVSFTDESKTDRSARVVGTDPETDLAVIKVIGGPPLVAATLGTSSDLVVGDPVIAIGSPLGLAGTVTTGIISALNRTVPVPSESGAKPAQPLFNAIQTDAAINPGNSGGALVDAAGRVIGINSAIATLGSSGTDTQSGSIGVGFAIPVDEARSIAEQLIRTGTATHPTIGVLARTVGADGIGPRGARIISVTHGGAAERAGLVSGDVVTAIAGEPVHSVDQLVVALREHRVGDGVTVTYLRGGATRSAKVVLQDKKSA
ncbi:MAG: putative serine protease match [Frankiales bacterium]|nr:putative serine protease match [Frankiales bacterium]